MKTPFLIGPSVYLRPVEVADAAAVQPWFNDPDVRRTVRRNQPMSLAAEEEFLRRASDSAANLPLAVMTRGEDRFIGLTGLHEIDDRSRHAAFGLLIGDKSMWGRGYGTEVTRLVVEHAFRTMNLNRVWLHVFEYNERGIRAYARVGFREEGRLRQHTFHDGRYWDVLTMGLLRDEWAAAQ